MALLKKASTGSSKELATGAPDKGQALHASDVRGAHAVALQLELVKLRCQCGNFCAAHAQHSVPEALC